MDALVFPIGKQESTVTLRPRHVPTVVRSKWALEEEKGLIRRLAQARKFKEAISKFPVLGDPIYLEWATISYEPSFSFPESALSPNPVVTQEKTKQLKSKIRSLLENDEVPAAPQAVDYACKLVGQFPSDCFLLPSPDISATSKGEVYFEWMLEKDGKLLLTVAPDGTVAYVCTFGTARSKNLGAWNDKIVDLILPCFKRLVQIQQKGLHEWDASKIVRPLPDLSSKETR